jgi:hypothetical protein
MISFRLPPIALFGLLSAGLIAAEGDPRYRLFVGVDLLVNQDEKRIPVVNIRRNELVVPSANGSRIPLKEAEGFSWIRSTKVSRAPITISDFEEHKAFTLQNDRGMQYMATQNNMAIYQQEKAAMAQWKSSQAQVMVSGAIQNQANLERAERGGMIITQESRDAAQAFMDNSMAELDEANIAMDEQFYQTESISGDTTFIDRLSRVDGEGGHDVLELTFQISSLEAIADAYLIVMGTVTQGEEEGITAFHHNIGAIGPEPRKITVRKTGFKPGFEIKDVNVHVFTHGREIASNRSDKNIGLTREQAREYLLLTHVTQHKGETIAPEPVWNLAPSALLANKSGDGFNYPVVVNVDADGSIISIHASEIEAQNFLTEIQEASALRTKSTPTNQQDSFAQSVRVTSDDAPLFVDEILEVPPTVIAAVSEMIFLPALDSGAPIASMTRVNLADFYR